MRAPRIQLSGMQNVNALFRLDGKVALIAGAASGIGRAAALGLAQAGAMALCADVDERGAERTAEEIRRGHGAAESFALDITDEAMVERAVQRAREKHSRIDALVSTPAVNVRKPLLDYSADEFDKVVRLNLKGTFLISRAVARGMKDTKSGSIVMVSSIRSVTTEPGQGVYAATKAGLNGTTRTPARTRLAAGRPPMRWPVRLCFWRPRQAAT
jgi:NAD(P)-dependent dehydrogenase (short-subunit alcohol dehydrogenase family)